MTRPNLLFLMTDEHRFDVAGFAGNSVVRTPNLDALSREAVIFDAAYTPSPICIPGRQCLMAGQRPSTCGCRAYGEDLAPGHLTWARQLSRYAYQTVACGKLHHLGPDQMQGWTQRVAPDAEIGARFIPDRVSEEFERYKRPVPAKWPFSKEIQRAGIGRGPGSVRDEFATRGALDFIEEYFNSPFYDRQGTQPLALKISLLQPHYPFFCDAERFNHYLNRVPLYLDESLSEHPALSHQAVRAGQDVSEREIRRATAAYYAMCEAADALLGQVVSALRGVGQNLDDWIVIFTSDHGEMLGQHSVWEKTHFYEGSARVPLFIRAPREFGAARRPENVSLCDLYATICELCGVPTPSGLDSRSLVPLLRGEGANWDNEAVSELGESVMIKRDALKYYWHGAAQPEVLWDLARDAGETTNFAARSEYAEAMRGFRARLDELGLGAARQ